MSTIDLMGGSQTVTGLDGVNLVVNGPGTLDYTGTANGVTMTVNNSAVIDIAGATDSATITDNGGNIHIGGTGNSTTITATNGSVDIIGAATSANFNLSGGHLTIGGAANSSTFDYGNGVSTVDLGAAIGLTSFENMNSNDGVVLSALTFDGGSYNGTTDVLTLTQGTTDVAALSVTLELGAPTNFNFGGVDSFSVAPCFTAGTRIATPDGEVPVERLAIGARVLTAAGHAKPIRWIGHRRFDCDRHPQPELVWPVRIRAGAFGEDRPRRDLDLSPDHALWLPGTGDDAANVLIPVKYLINGATIAQRKVAQTHYFHVELATHDILLAEGLPAESYLDTGNRAQFENGAAHLSLHPDFAALSWDYACAPLCVDGPAVAAARRHLLARIAGLGYRRTAESDLYVLVNGRAIRPAAIKGKLHRFMLPAGTTEARIVSRSGVPAGLDLDCEDCRRLGARIGGIVADGKIVLLDGPLLAAGFHPVERQGHELWRWTDGDARLVLPHASPRPGTLELLVRETMQSWIAPNEAAGALAA